MPIDSDSLSLLYFGSLSSFSKKEREAEMHVFVLFLSITLKHLAASIGHLKPSVPLKARLHRRFLRRFKRHEIAASLRRSIWNSHKNRRLNRRKNGLCKWALIPFDIVA